MGGIVWPRLSSFSVRRRAPAAGARLRTLNENGNRKTALGNLLPRRYTPNSVVGCQPAVKACLTAGAGKAKNRPTQETKRRLANAAGAQRDRGPGHLGP